MNSAPFSTDFSSLGRSLSGTDTAHGHGGSARGSHAVSPSKVLHELAVTLQNRDVPGPFLLRSATEFTEVLGHGVYSEIRGASDQVIKRDQAIQVNGIERTLPSRVGCIAIKQHRARGNTRASARQAREYLGKHSEDALREIIALTCEPVRNHANIVKLLGWGLCLDALEDETMERVSIPLLILEKAHGDLYTILQIDSRSSPSRISTAERSKLCADIGHGLQALHSLSLSHGDLKTQKILVFKSSRGLTAKLCGFDTAIGHSSVLGLSFKGSRYVGTPGWRAPEILASSQIPDSVKCDVYAYGLVVWSVFAKHGRNCLDTTEEWSVRTRERASKSVKKYLPSASLSQKLLKEAVLMVLHDSLAYEPLHRQLQPWRYFTPISKQFATVLHDRLHFLKGVPTWVSSSLYAAVKSPVFSARREQSQLPPYRKIEAYAEFARHAGFDNDIVAHNTEQLFPDSNGVNTFEHTSHSCLEAPWLTKLHSRVYRVVTRKRASYSTSRQLTNRELIYCYARYRSRFKLCCWEQYCSRTENVLAGYLENAPTFDFEIFAWLCRGQTGAAEIARVPILEIERHFCSAEFSESQRLQCFILLLQSGLSLEAPSSSGTKASSRFEQSSILLSFVNTFRPASASTAMRLICKRFASCQNSELISDSTRSFFLGKNLQGRSNRSVKTALHEFAAELNYDAVENLLKVGADPNVEIQTRNGSSQTVSIGGFGARRRLAARKPATVLFGSSGCRGGVAVQSSFKNVMKITLSAQPRGRKQSLAKDRILALLSSKQSPIHTGHDDENEASTRTPLLEKARQLPPGWTAHNVPASPFRNASVGQRIWRFLSPSSSPEQIRIKQTASSGIPRFVASSDKVTFYQETFTGSLTWQKPSFSFLSKSHIVLEHRRLHGYYLDLIAFLTPPVPTALQKAIQIRFPVIEDSWYRQEPFMDMATDDPLALLTESWTKPFNIRDPSRLFSASPLLLPTAMVCVSFIVLCILLWVFFGFYHNFDI